MKRSHLLLLGVAMYACAWFVLVIKGGDTLSDGVLPGWQAFRVSLSPIWHYGNDTGGGNSVVMNALSVASGLSNFVFVAAALVGFARGGVSRGVWFLLALCAVVNTHWFVMSDARGDLRLGYYLWMLSYFVAAGALRRPRN